ncbi:centrosomal protein of 85 kDa-like [Polypterus senegalus]|uniref:centrosomal protein of 85 kDa-like n=1 Tax=Polypterus senegalus TaxID=55291 RepID=UPI00196418A0|nr:centrosomal protein of 85 kDa-like [Polypterus senegalus]
MMWSRIPSDHVDKYEHTTGSDTPNERWLPGENSAWEASASTASSYSTRRRCLSTTSDSGDTGIGTSCSDSVEDHSSSSSTYLFKPVSMQGSIPTALVMPSTTNMRPSMRIAGTDRNSCYTLPNHGRSTGTQDGPLDMKDPRPIKRWSSLTKLSVPGNCSVDGRAYMKDDLRTCKEGLTDSAKSYRCKLAEVDNLHFVMGHLTTEERQLNQIRSLGPDPRCKLSMHNKVNSSPTPSLTSKSNALDLSFCALPESKPVATGSEMYKTYNPLGQQTIECSPIQPSVRTQMWLSEQMHSNHSKLQDSSCRLTSFNQLEHFKNAEMPQVMPLVKLKEDELNKKEQIISWQAQQIHQLQQRIRENELQTQVLQGPVRICNNPYHFQLKEMTCDSLPLQTELSVRSQLFHGENEGPDSKLAAAKLEIARLSEVLKQRSSKNTEEIRKLEERLKTRDRYISSLKKRCQRESEMNQEKQQRIETLETYLADLPTLDEIQKQTEQIELLKKEKCELQDSIEDLKKKWEDGRLLIKEKETFIERQKKKEKELIITVQSLQQKVEKCLEDGVRLPMMDMKQLEHDNDLLREEKKKNNQVIDNQRKQIEKLAIELQAMEHKLTDEKSLSQDLQAQLKEKEDYIQELKISMQENQRQLEECLNMRTQTQQDEQKLKQPCNENLPLAEELLKEMSYCLVDLKALCSILTERAQGKEPNLVLLLGIRSMNYPGEEHENLHSESSLSAKLLEVSQLRKDIDKLRTMVSDRYAQDMGDSCITQ